MEFSSASQWFEYLAHLHYGFVANLVGIQVPEEINADSVQ